MHVRPCVCVHACASLLVPACSCVRARAQERVWVGVGVSVGARVRARAQALHRPIEDARRQQRSAAREQKGGRLQGDSRRSQLLGSYEYQAFSWSEFSVHGNVEGSRLRYAFGYTLVGQIPHTPLPFISLAVRASSLCCVCALYTFLCASPDGLPFPTLHVRAPPVQSQRRGHRPPVFHSFAFEYFVSSFPTPISLPSGNLPPPPLDHRPCEAASSSQQAVAQLGASFKDPEMQNLHFVILASSFPRSAHGHKTCSALSFATLLIYAKSTAAFLRRLHPCPLFDVKLLLTIVYPASFASRYSTGYALSS
eukprot:6179015-Pleurochrysis_carterae.AAC.4